MSDCTVDLRGACMSTIVGSVAPLMDGVEQLVSGEMQFIRRATSEHGIRVP
jgi:hypothetical protein